MVAPPNLRQLAVFAAALCAPFLTASAEAALVFYYDPDTGNVSFDTANTRSGELTGYALAINPYNSDVRFLPDGLIRIHSSTLFEQDPLLIGDYSFSNTVSGLITIGNVLPPGLSEEFWTSTFVGEPVQFGYGPVTNRHQDGHHLYNDIIGGGKPPLAEFVYGAPGREFDNGNDLIDPDSLRWAQAATLVYQQATGQVILDTTGAEGGHIIGFTLESEGAFEAASFRAPVESFVSSAEADLVGVFADLIEPGQYPLGQILPAGLSEAALRATFTHASFVSRSGFGRSFLNIDTDTDGLPLSLAFVAVPEPASVVAAAAIGVLFACCRRRVPLPAARS